MTVTRENILAIMPNAGAAVGKYLPYINKYATDFGVNTPLRMAHFLAQIAVESSELRTVEENLNYSAKGLLSTFPKYFTAAIAKLYARNPQKIANRVYANRYGNGDEASGDGWRYRGRGLIQLTFKANYKNYKDFCGYDVVNNPELLSRPLGATRCTFWFWKKRNLNILADADNVVAIRKAINGGTHGLSMAKVYLSRAKKVFCV